MRVLRYVLSLLCVACLAFSFPVAAEINQGTESRNDAPLMQVGVHFSRTPFGGITIKKRVSDSTILQGTISLTDVRGSLGGRLLLDLGTKGQVFRYAGIGGAIGYQSHWYGADATREPIMGLEAFIGLDYPMEWFGKATPFSTSLEVVVQGVSYKENGQSHLTPYTGVNAGLHYWF